LKTKNENSTIKLQRDSGAGLRSLVGCRVARTAGWPMAVIATASVGSSAKGAPDEFELQRHSLHRSPRLHGRPTRNLSFCLNLYTGVRPSAVLFLKE